MAQKKKKRTWLLFPVFLVLLVLAVPVPFVYGTSLGRIFSVDTVPNRDVAIVFGAGIWSDGTPQPYLKARLDIAKQLYDQGLTKVILVSGSDEATGYSEPNVMRNYLVENGVPENHVVVDYAGDDTYSTCVRARKIFSVRSAILVTQSYHLPRAIASCQLKGLDSVGVGDDSVAELNNSVWISNTVRDYLADYKLIYDFFANREPILGEQEDGVTKALENWPN
ncbi:MAG: YdcF family protein [Propionibacteriaceae bacterium]|jgi:vancomycin permeability regulator SanA|nr:YdcF family protein [Propionibacteriaceae bacterium]